MNATCFALGAGSASIGTWRTIRAPQVLEQFAGCPLLDERYVKRMHLARLKSTDLMVPHFSPSACQMPSFDTKRLLRLLAGRTLVVVGDSVSEQHFHSLACTLLTANESAQRHRSLWWPPNATRHELWKTRSCLPLAYDAVLCLLTIGKRNELHAPPDWLAAHRLRTALRAADIVLLNIGVHFEHASTAAAHFEQITGPLLGSVSGERGPLIIFRETVRQVPRTCASVMNLRLALAYCR